MNPLSEIDLVACDFADRFSCPERIGVAAVLRLPADISELSGRRDAVIVQFFRDCAESEPGGAESEYSQHYPSGLIINRIRFVLRVAQISIWDAPRRREKLAAFHLRRDARLYLLRYVLRVGIVQKHPEGHQKPVSVRVRVNTVIVVIDAYEANIELWKGTLQELARRDVLTTKARGVLYDDAVYSPRLDVGVHLGKARTPVIHAAVAVVGVELHNLYVILFREMIKTDFLLVSD